MTHSDIKLLDAWLEMWALEYSKLLSKLQEEPENDLHYKNAICSIEHCLRMIKRFPEATKKNWIPNNA